MIWGSGSPGVRSPVSREVEQWRAIREIAERLGSISGRRKAIVWITHPPNLHPLVGAERLPERLDSAQAQIAQGWGHILAAWQEAAQTAVHNNVAIYPVDPRGLTTDLGIGSLVGQASMREVAEETGGIAVVNTNNFSRFYEAIVQDASTYYLLGYTPEPEQTDGDFHSIRVRVKREGVPFAPAAATTRRRPPRSHRNCCLRRPKACRSPHETRCDCLSLPRDLAST